MKGNSSNNKKPYHLIDFDTTVNDDSSQTVFHIDLLSIVAESFAEIAELKDKETGNHIKRVAILAELVAQALKVDGILNLSERFIQLLRISVPLHDIGKVGIADDILLKTGALNWDEFETMKKHSMIGAHILGNLHAKIQGYNIDYFNIAANIAKYHHERYDGLGYPDGLVGEAIPIEAQITSLVDVFDALMSKRSYKEAYSIETSMAIIIEGKNSRFNPVLVEILENNLDRIVEIYSLLKD